LGNGNLSPNDAEWWSEPLYGIARVDEIDKRIDIPGNLQVATINLAYELKKTVNLTPFNLEDPGDGMSIQDPLYEPGFADDIIYGGLGNDFLHGGAGDDAISGAEALPDYYNSPYNPGNLLRWSEDRAGEFAAYDEFNPLSKILIDDTGAWTYGYSNVTSREFYLNFNADEGVFRPGGVTDLNGQQVEEYDPVYDDGSDSIFGDLGNDWIVGGTGQDHLWGGRGDDLLNADDDHDSPQNERSEAPIPDRANDTPDSHPSYEDIAYGGAGRDVIIGNTGGDRLIDWAGEFNSYLVPFAPFGAFAISRRLQPQLMEYLYDLSEGDGVDPTRAYDTGNDELRNGEPDGEIGLVMQKDADWGDQTGAPDDIQPGNIPGGQRDVLRGTDFNNANGASDSDGTLIGFASDSGSWIVEGGRLSVSPESLGGDAVSVYYVDSVLPQYFEIEAIINAAKPTAGWKSNAYIIFDYQNPTDFKFAGVNISTDKIELGHRTADGWIVDEQVPVQVKPDLDYHLLLSINGLVATLVVDGSELFTHVYETRIDEYGVSWGLNGGMVGLGANNSTARIDNLKVQILPPEMTLQEMETFDDGSVERFVPQQGTWQILDGSYIGNLASDGQKAFSSIILEVRPAYLMRLTSTVSGQALFGYIFDRYSEEDYKFVALSADSDQVIIGHYTKRTGFHVDASVDYIIDKGADYSLEVTLKGSTVSVVVDDQALLGYAYNALVLDGAYGLFTEGGQAIFDNVTIMTDDPQYEGMIINSAPVAVNDSLETEEGATLTFSIARLLANDTDVDGDILSLISFTYSGTGTLEDNGDGTLIYTPFVGFAGTDTFTYRAGDGNLTSNEATVTITVDPNLAGTYTYTMDTAAIIPDNGFDTYTITVSDSFTIVDLNIVLNITHTRDNDLRVVLINPDGLVIELFAYVGDRGEGFIGTNLDDDALTSIVDGTAPFTGVYRPVGDLSLLEGMDVQGNWTLEIYDVKKFETGTLNSWSLVVERGDSLTVAGGPVAPAGTAHRPLTQNVLDAFVVEAVSRLTLAGFVAPSSAMLLESVNFEVADLAGGVIGLAGQDIVLIDVNAAGYGWFLDKTLYDDLEFTADGNSDILTILDSSSRAAGAIDLLSVVMHELGHVLGYEHDSGVSFMSDTLDPGTRFNLNLTDTSYIYSFEEISGFRGKDQSEFSLEFNVWKYCLASYFVKIRTYEDDDFLQGVLKDDKFQLLLIKLEDALHPPAGPLFFDMK